MPCFSYSCSNHTEKARSPFVMQDKSVCEYCAGCDITPGEPIRVIHSLGWEPWPLAQWTNHISCYPESLSSADWVVLNSVDLYRAMAAILAASLPCSETQGGSTKSQLNHKPVRSSGTLKASVFNRS